ncbi:hypothetical protein MMC21_000974 [Puttea exsequens]|nr:hypothetical protein [Puttea exsequens]
MPAPSLTDTARKVCSQNWRWLLENEAFEDTAYHLVRDILFKIADPKKLRSIEIKAPHFCGADGEIWLEFIKRDVPGWKEKLHKPKNPENWYKVYQRLVEQSEREIERDAQVLKATLHGIKKESDKHKLQQIELAKVNLPSSMKRNGPMMNIRCDLRQGVPRGPYNPNHVKAKVVKPAKGKLDKLRKETRSMSHFSQSGKLRPNDSATPVLRPTSTPSPSKLTIAKAPVGMIEEYRRPTAWQPTDPTVPPPRVFAPKRRRTEPDESQPETSGNTNEREQKLKAFTNPSGATRSAADSKPSKIAISNTSNPASPLNLTMKAGNTPSSITRKTFANTNTLSPSKPTTPEAISLGPARSNTSSPANAGSPAPKAINHKAPVDIFMRPSKRPRMS